MSLEGTKEKMKNPIRAIFDFKKEEIPIAFLMFSFSETVTYTSNIICGISFSLTPPSFVITN